LHGPRFVRYRWSSHIGSFRKHRRVPGRAIVRQRSLPMFCGFQLLRHRDVPREDEVVIQTAPAANNADRGPARVGQDRDTPTSKSCRARLHGKGIQKPLRSGKVPEFLWFFGVFGRFPWLPGWVSYAPGPILESVFPWLGFCRQKPPCTVSPKPISRCSGRFLFGVFALRTSIEPLAAQEG
jgi:hypothetical protein